MKKRERSIEKINDDIRSAGKSFLGLHMGELIKRVKELDNSSFKKKIIEEYYSNQVGFYDKKISGTTTRINSAIRIIKAEKVVYVLEQITGYNLNVDSRAELTAKETIQKIKKGEIILPDLE